MPYIPNSADAATDGAASTADIDALDFDVLVASIGGRGVVSGCAVTAQGSPDMTVAVASGVVRVGGANVTVTAGNATITAAHGSLPRFDLVTVTNAGTKTVVAGTAATNPVFPSLPSTSVLLAAVLVPAASTTVTGARIVDKRVTIGSSVSGGADHLALINIGVS